MTGYSDDEDGQVLVSRTSDRNEMTLTVTFSGPNASSDRGTVQSAIELQLSKLGYVTD